MEGCVGRVGQPTTRTGSSTFCRFGSTGAASPPPPEDTPESAKRAVSADSSFASRGRTRGDVGASAEPGAAAFGEDGGDDFGDAARVTLDRAAASAPRVKRGCA